MNRSQLFMLNLFGVIIIINIILYIYFFNYCVEVPHQYKKSSVNNNNGQFDDPIETESLQMVMLRQITEMQMLLKYGSFDINDPKDM